MEASKPWPYVTIVHGRVVYRAGQHFDAVGLAAFLNRPGSGPGA
jgi:hypothetical protein